MADAIPADKQAKLTAYRDKLTAVTTAANAITNATFDTDFKKLPLIVDYVPRVGGKSRRRNNKKNNKSRRRNQSKRQRK